MNQAGRHLRKVLILMTAQLSNLLFIGALVAVFWFLIVRPQQQRAKQQRAMLAALAPGDEIVTIGGIFGVVVDVDERVRIRVADGSELEVANQAIARIVPASEKVHAEPGLDDLPTAPRDEDSGIDA